MPSTPIVVTLDYLTMLYPEFADETPDRIAALDTWATGLVSFGVFGKNYLYAKSLMIAHQIALGRQKGKGMTTSQKIGDIQRDYSGPGEVASGLALTAYGLKYQELARAYTAGPRCYPEIPSQNPSTFGMPQ